VLLEGLREASASTQVVVTSHSPDLLDDSALEVPELLAVVADENGTSIGSLDELARAKLRDRLCTPGELLRLGELRPERIALRAATEQLELFGE
jgi:hypothetical protein